MVETLGKLAKFIAGQPGYFREGCEEEFPWHATDRSVWYALLVVECGKIARYGFTSSKANKLGLCAALESLTEGDQALLLGIWNGQYSAHLFVLEPREALARLKGDKRWARFESLRNITNVVKVYSSRGGFKLMSYQYLNAEGTPVPTSVGSRDEAEDLEAFFRSEGIDICEVRQ
jgi:hypothetical protein